MAPRRTAPRTPDLPERLRPRKAPTQRRSRALVDAIVEGGARVLAARGWDGLTLQEVAAVAGVSPGSLYQYFPDKAALVAEITARQSARELAFHLERFAALTPDTPLEDALRLMFSAILEFQRREGPLMRATLAALQHLGRYQLLAARAQEAVVVLRAVLEAHRGRIAVDDLDLATHVVANAVHSLTHDGVLPRPPRLDDAALLAELERLVLGYLLRPPTVARG